MLCLYTCTSHLGSCVGSIWFYLFCHASICSDSPLVTFGLRGQSVCRTLAANAKVKVEQRMRQAASATQ